MFDDEIREGLAAAREQEDAAIEITLVEGELHFRGDIRAGVMDDPGLKGPHPLEGWLVPATASYDEGRDRTTVTYRRATTADTMANLLSRGVPESFSLGAVR